MYTKLDLITQFFDIVQLMCHPVLIGSLCTDLLCHSNQIKRSMCCAVINDVVLT